MTHRFENYLQSGSSLRSGFAPGSFLIASPILQSTPFERTVVFVLQDNEQGTFGVVVNRPADDQLKSVWREMTGLESDGRFMVHGGPIGGPVFALHQEKSLAELEMPGGICVSADRKVFLQLTRQQDSNYRIVFGVAGWQLGQLASEIKSGQWFQLNADPHHLFDDSADMWENFLRQYGRQVLESLIGSGRIPKSPWLN